MHQNGEKRDRATSAHGSRGRVLEPPKVAQIRSNSDKFVTLATPAGTVHATCAHRVLLLPIGEPVSPASINTPTVYSGNYCAIV